MIYEEYLRHFRYYQTVNFKDKHFLKVITSLWTLGLAPL